MAYHNDLRLHSAIGCVAPKDRLEVSTEAIMADRGRKLSAVRDARKAEKEADRAKEGGENWLWSVKRTRVLRERNSPGIADRVATNIAQGDPSVPPPALRMRADRCSELPPCLKKTQGAGTEPQVKCRRHLVAGSCL